MNNKNVTYTPFGYKFVCVMTYKETKKLDKKQFVCLQPAYDQYNKRMNDNFYAVYEKVDDPVLEQYNKFIKPYLS